MHSGAESVIYLYKKIKNKYRVHCDESVSNMKTEDLKSQRNESLEHFNK